MDVHGLTWKEAREQVVEQYNLLVARGVRVSLDVVHGYGASGEGGMMRPALRSFLTRQAVAFTPGEQADGNPGHTLIHPGKVLPTATDRLQADIVAYCETAKTKEQVAGRFRRFGEPEVARALKGLQAAGLLKVVNIKGSRQYLAE